MKAVSHRSVRESLRQRIESGEWELGALIPAEAVLAEDYGCARTTINRALQSLAEEGLIVRKRKGGTRITNMPVRQAKFEIPIIREQVEATGSAYHHHVITREQRIPPVSVRTRLRLEEGAEALYIETCHLADDRPFAFEQRWVNLEAVPEIVDAPFDELSVNEWLVQTVPFSNGDILFSAENANPATANALETEPGRALFLVDRTTWMSGQCITTMKLYYKEGYQLYSKL